VLKTTMEFRVRLFSLRSSAMVLPSGDRTAPGSQKSASGSEATTSGSPQVSPPSDDKVL